jgi:peptide/nickel transport system permease protein
MSMHRAVTEQRVEPPSAEEPRPARRAWRIVLLRNWTSTLALLLLLVIAAAAALAALVAPFDPLAIDPIAMLAGPSAHHLMGTDELGRDLLSRVIYGGRVSLGTAAVVVAASAVTGVAMGLLAGYFGGIVDIIFSRLIDVILAFPAILLAMGLIAVLGEGTLNAGVAVTVVSIPSFARLARASALVEKEREYVEAARALGASHRWILLRSILPNSIGPLVVQAGVTATNAILLEAALSFLGLGTRPPTPSWGQMLSTSRGYLYQAWWYGLFPGIALTLVVLSLNHLADAAQRIATVGWRRL